MKGQKEVSHGGVLPREKLSADPAATTARLEGSDVPNATVMVGGCESLWFSQLTSQAGC